MLEEMGTFFSERSAEYDSVHTGHIGGSDSFAQIAANLPAECKTLLDLGCGTGLEFPEIFARFPDIEITGIDLSEGMLEQLKKKFPDKNLHIFYRDYFRFTYPVETFDAAMSSMTLHHFTWEEKVPLYEKTRKAIKPHGVYIECDYMALDETYQRCYREEYNRLLSEMDDKNGYFHFDTPYTPENQIKMMLEAGFSSAEVVWRQENTVLIVAKK